MTQKQVGGGFYLTLAGLIGLFLWLLLAGWCHTVS
jgi:hypothetical protein